MNNERDDLLNEIRETLRVAPSVNFQARVRAQVADEPTGARTWFGTRALALAAVVVASVAVWGVWPVGEVTEVADERREAPAPVARVEGRPAETVQAREPESGATSAASTAATMDKGGRLVRPTTRPVVNSAPAPIVLDTPAPLIEAAQARLLEEFVAAIEEGRVEPPRHRSIDAPVEIEELPAPRPVEIALIRVEPLLDAGAEAPALRQNGAS